MLERVLIGALLALVIALAARRTRSLAPSGAAAAVVAGTLGAAAGWTWAIVLIAYFIVSSALSRAGRLDKERRTAAIVAKGGERDAVQVVANGGGFMLGALLFVIHPDVAWLAFGLGSLAAAAADTWATEIGTWFGGIPRSILTFAPVAAGRSGGVTPLGTLAAAAGACFVALVARLLGVTPTVGIAIAAGGFAGALLDSLLGAVAQAQRWCSACTVVTERVVHDCGTVTTPHRGLSWLDNDAVNLASTLLGGLLAAWMAR